MALLVISWKLETAGKTGRHWITLPCTAQMPGKYTQDAFAERLNVTVITSSQNEAINSPAALQTHCPARYTGLAGLLFSCCPEAVAPCCCPAPVLAGQTGLPRG